MRTGEENRGREGYKSCIEKKNKGSNNANNLVKKYGRLERGWILKDEK